VEQNSAMHESWQDEKKKLTIKKLQTTIMSAVHLCHKVFSLMDLASQQIRQISSTDNYR